MMEKVAGIADGGNLLCKRRSAPPSFCPPDSTGWDTKLAGQKRKAE